MFCVKLICSCLLLLTNEPTAVWKIPSSWLTDAANFSATERLIMICFFCRHVIPTWKVATTWRRRIGNTARYCCHLWHFLLTTCTLFCRCLSNVTILFTYSANRNFRHGRIVGLYLFTSLSMHASQCDAAYCNFSNNEVLLQNVIMNPSGVPGGGSTLQPNKLIK